MTLEYEEITISLPRPRPGHSFCEEHPVCCECSRFFTIWSDGLVSYAACCESSALEKDYEEDLELVKETIKILEQAINKIKQYYNIRET